MIRDCSNCRHFQSDGGESCGRCHRTLQDSQTEITLPWWCSYFSPESANEDPELIKFDEREVPASVFDSRRK